MNYKFKDKNLFEMAVTHTSYANEKGRDKNFNYERLEFLGDTVVNFIVSKWLFLNFPQMDEGEMSNLRAALVSKESLAEAARKLGLHKKIKLSKGEEKSGGRDNDSIVSDVFEAWVAAVYLDGGFGEAEKIVVSALEDKMEIISEATGKPADYRTALQEFIQKQGFPPPEYKVISEQGPQHRKTFVVEVKIEGPVLLRQIGEGRSKKEAMSNAAKNVWESLRGKEQEIIKDKFFIG